MAKRRDKRRRNKARKQREIDNQVTGVHLADERRLAEIRKPQEPTDTLDEPKEPVTM